MAECVLGSLPGVRAFGLSMSPTGIGSATAPAWDVTEITASASPVTCRKYPLGETFRSLSSGSVMTM